MTISRKTKTVKLLLELFDKENNALPVVDLVSIFSKERVMNNIHMVN